MRELIDGRSFDTDKAVMVAEWDNGLGTSDARFERVQVFRKKTGEFFLHGWGGTATSWRENFPRPMPDGRTWAPEGIVPVTRERARELVEGRLGADEARRIFEGGAPVTMSLRIPAPLYRAIDAEAARAGEPKARVIISTLAAALGVDL